MIAVFAFALLAGAALILPVAEMSTTDDIDDTDTDEDTSDSDNSDDSGADDTDDGDDGTTDDSDDGETDDGALDDDELVEAELPLIIPVLEIPETPELDEDAIVVSSSELIDNGADIVGKEYSVTTHDTDIFAGSGDDTFVIDVNEDIGSAGYADAIKIHTGDGDDVVFGDADYNRVVSITGGSGDDFYYGGGFIDRIEDTEGSDVAFGNDGSDTITLGDESTIYGGQGNDVLSAGDNSAVAGGEGRDVIRLNNNGTAEGGSDRDILLALDGIDNTLYGGDGNDRLNSGGENTLYGGDGIDTIYAVAGDNVFGGEGADIYNITVQQDDTSPAIINDFVSGEDVFGNIQIYVDATDDGNIDLDYVEREDGLGTNLVLNGKVILEVYGAEPADFENISIEVQGAETIVADAGPAAAIDASQDGGSATTLLGSHGDDTLIGGENDVVYGGDGDDIVGSDSNFQWVNREPEATETTLFGGEGNDTFVIEAEDTSNYFNSSADTAEENVAFIADYNPDEDVISVSLTLKLGYDNFGEYPPIEDDEVQVVAWEDGLGASIVVGDFTIANIPNGQDLTLEDIKLSFDYDYVYVGP